MFNGTPPLHKAAGKGHLACVDVLAVVYPHPAAWFTFLVGSGALSAATGLLQAYLQPPVNSATCNYLPILYKPDVIKEIWKFLHKPRYVDPAQLDIMGRTALQVAEQFGKDEVAVLLRFLLE